MSSVQHNRRWATYPLAMPSNIPPTTETKLILKRSDAVDGAFGDDGDQDGVDHDGNAVVEEGLPRHQELEPLDDPEAAEGPDHGDGVGGGDDDPEEECLGHAETGDEVGEQGHCHHHEQGAGQGVAEDGVRVIDEAVDVEVQGLLEQYGREQHGYEDVRAEVREGEAGREGGGEAGEYQGNGGRETEAPGSQGDDCDDDQDIEDGVELAEGA